ncbi:lipase secretion chaperone [Chitinivorax sp. PXF-14]|uniref:lipase secretion chaperone n=1 Tax=Chitinivorax sp. PXF-14 TaxID=3230488 RepID=UPI00346757B5
MGKTLLLSAAALGAVAVFGAYAGFHQTTATTITTAPQAAASEPAAFARSFVDTRPDGELAGGNGELKLSPELLRRFDYYLSAIGERSLADIQAAIERDLTRELKPADAARAKHILAQYLAFKRALADVRQDRALGGQTLDAMRVRLASIRQTRSRFFTPTEIQALFGDDDTQADLALDRLAIQRNASLSLAQKQARLAELDARLSPQQRAEREAPVQHQTLAAQVDAARAHGASDADVLALRTAAVGGEAAERLAALDREDAAWKARIHDYLAERSRVLANTQLAPADRDAALARLRDARFDSQEQLRLPAYEPQPAG